MMRPILALLAIGCFASACGGDAATTTPSAAVSPTVETFMSSLSGGRAWRLVTVRTAGVISLTLTESGSPSTPVGLGLGVPGGSSCLLSIAVVVEPSASPQIAERVDAGDYCAEVQDLRGPNASFMRFSLTIEYP